MRVTFNHFPDTLLGRLQSLGREQNKALIQLSTGQRIDAPSDDAPAMQRVLNLRTEKKQNQQFYRNAIDGLERSKVTFSSLEQIKDLLGRASELSANISGASSEQEYSAKAAEIDQLIKQGVNVANTRLRGNYLFSGDTTLVEPFKLENNKVSYLGSNDETQIRIGEGSTSVLSVAATPDENKKIALVLNKLIEMRDAMRATPSPGKAETILALRAERQTSLPVSGAGQNINLPAGHGLQVGDAITFNLSNNQGNGLVTGSLYYVKEINGDSIKVSTTPDGEPVNFTTGLSGASTFAKARFDTVEDEILAALSRAGTVQYRLETAMKDLEARYEATEQLISTDADIDFAEATIRLNRAQTAYQAAIQSGANIQSRSLLDYLR
jgi:flagellar hook-associated protein 3 FlgL